MIFVIFPAYNEEYAIYDAIRSLWKAVEGDEHLYQAVLVDDGSTDRTVEEAERAANETAGKLKLRIFKHGDNRGLGAGLRTGLFGVLETARDDDVIVTLDADNTHPPKLIPGMIQKLNEGYDLVIASRYRKGAVIHGVPSFRRALSDCGRILFQLLFYIRGARDYTCCFRAYRVPILRKARIVYGEDFCTARGFEAVMDILLRLSQLGARVAEVPLELQYEHRVGRSKMQVMKTMRRTIALLCRRSIERFGKYNKSTIAARLRAAGAGEAAGR
ncbi:MAG: glycosyltransferase family 2 protein [Planctomycetes bacterium]|nr:glycosyltransferase family 2 protein [Planctomycetota bacterium]